MAHRFDKTDFEDKKQKRVDLETVQPASGYNSVVNLRKLVVKIAKVLGLEITLT